MEARAFTMKTDFIDAKAIADMLSINKVNPVCNGK